MNFMMLNRQIFLIIDLRMSSRKQSTTSQRSSITSDDILCRKRISDGFDNFRVIETVSNTDNSAFVNRCLLT